MPIRRTLVICSKKRAASSTDKLQRYGRTWVWIAFDPESKLAIDYRVDDQTLDACRAFIRDLTAKLTNIPFFTSDELGHYMVALWENYRLDPELQWDSLPFKERPNAVHPDLDYAVFHKVRENGKVISTQQNVIYGDPDRIREKFTDSASNQINTAFIERYNGTMRQLNGNLHRKSQYFAKNLYSFQCRMAIVTAYYNFVKPHGTLSKKSDASYSPITPAQAKGITDSQWTVKELLSIPRITSYI